MKKFVLLIAAVLLYPVTYLYLMSHIRKTKKSFVYLFIYVVFFGIWCMGFFTVYGYCATDTGLSFQQEQNHNVVKNKGHSAVLNTASTETTTETAEETTVEATSETTSETTTEAVTEPETEPVTSPNEKYNIDCYYNYDGGLSGEKGTFSGLWQGLEAAAENRSEGWTALKQWVGDTSEIRVCEYEQDNFKDINGFGTVNWSQGGHEWYSPYSCSGGAQWSQASCGVCSVAIVLSTLSGKAVTPPEIALAADVLLGEQAWSGDIILTEAQAELIRLAGFRADTVPYYEASKEKMDDCLNQNGMVIFVTSSQTWASGGNHYIVVRNMKDGLYYTSDSGKNPTGGFSYDEISAGYNQQDVVYVYPKNIN